jgi:hypothetical protein
LSRLGKSAWSATPGGDYFFFLVAFFAAGFAAFFLVAFFAAAFFTDFFEVFLTAVAVDESFLFLPKIFAQPVAYLSLEPTRKIVTVVKAFIWERFELSKEK